MRGPRSASEVAVTLGWVAAAQGGDREAFARLYSEYRPTVAASIARQVRDRNVVEDLTSTTFLKAWARLDTFTDRGMDPIRWLCTIARNTVRDHAKSARVNREVSVGAETPEPRHDRETATSSEPGEVIEARERQARVAGELGRALAGLPEAQRQVLVDYDLAPTPRPPMRQVAGGLGRGPAAGSTLRHRALVQLRRSFAEQGITSSHQLLDHPTHDTPAGDTIPTGRCSPSRARTAVALARARVALTAPADGPAAGSGHTANVAGHCGRVDTRCDSSPATGYGQVGG